MDDRCELRCGDCSVDGYGPPMTFKQSRKVWGCERCGSEWKVFQDGCARRHIEVEPGVWIGEQ